MMDVKKLKNSFNPVQILWRNKTRTFLTSLGIIIGIASVIIIISVGAGAQSLILNQIKGIGSDLLGILPGGTDESGRPSATLGVSVTTLTYEDVQAMAKLPEVSFSTGYSRGVGTVTWQNRTTDTNFVGVTSSYPKVEEAEVVVGRFLLPEEDFGVIKNVILGWQVKEDLFGDIDPLNETIKINKETFRIVGVMEERGSAGFQNQDDQVFIPIETAQKLLLGVNHLGFARAKIADGVDTEVAAAAVSALLRDRHDIENAEEDDFTVGTSEEAISSLKSITDALNYFLAAVAAISLLVGGVGVMNIMFVAVSERTREIGLRKAVGAKPRDISRQFLAEALLLTSFGGLIGILFGISFSWLVSLVAQGLGYDWDFVISAFSIILAVGFIAVVGLAFGWYPSVKAAGLNPVEALRYE
ncbi:ABC transporter permease [Patescibacteria group bacterium]|nr:ABC transporter permease [Patescibacteria group bacterium]